VTAAWTIYGRAAIDGRGPVGCVLTIRTDGVWSAEVSTFTLADTVDLLFASDSGGRFCGPAFVARSRVDSDPLRAVTELTCTGPLLVIAPGMDQDDREIDTQHASALEAS